MRLNRGTNPSLKAIVLLLILDTLILTRALPVDVATSNEALSLRWVDEHDVEELTIRDPSGLNPGLSKVHGDPADASRVIDSAQTTKARVTDAELADANLRAQRRIALLGLRKDSTQRQRLSDFRLAATPDPTDVSHAIHASQTEKSRETNAELAEAQLFAQRRIGALDQHQSSLHLGPGVPTVVVTLDDATDAASYVQWRMDLLDRTVAGPPDPLEPKRRYSPGSQPLKPTKAQKLSTELWAQSRFKGFIEQPGNTTQRPKNSLRGTSRKRNKTAGEGAGSGKVTSPPAAPVAQDSSKLQDSPSASPPRASTNEATEHSPDWSNFPRLWD